MTHRMLGSGFGGHRVTAPMKSSGLTAVELSSQQLKAAVRLATTAIVVELRGLPRMREPDGSAWVEAEKLDALIARLESL